MHTEFLPEKKKLIKYIRHAKKHWIKLEDVINVDIRDVVFEVIWLGLVGREQCPQLDFYEHTIKPLGPCNIFLTK
jgi:hypothetical protein